MHRSSLRVQGDSSPRDVMMQTVRTCLRASAGVRNERGAYFYFYFFLIIVIVNAAERRFGGKTLVCGRVLLLACQSVLFCLPTTEDLIWLHSSNSGSCKCADCASL